MNRTKLSNLERSEIFYNEKSVARIIFKKEMHNYQVLQGARRAIIIVLKTIKKLEDGHDTIEPPST